MLEMFTEIAVISNGFLPEVPQDEESPKKKRKTRTSRALDVYKSAFV